MKKTLILGAASLLALTACTDPAYQQGGERERTGQGVAIGDYDDDGFDDIYVTNAGTNVLMATGTNFPDALGAAAVAARVGATLILTTPATLPTQTASYLNRRPPTTITILGGTNAITRTTETQLATNHLR